MNKEIFAALSALEKENHIDKEILIDKIKQGIMKAIKREDYLVQAELNL